MKLFSIHDRLNYFGKVTGDGSTLKVLDEAVLGGDPSGGTIYVGQGNQTAMDQPYGMIDTRKRSKDGQGGQLGQPFFAEFFFSEDNNTADMVFEVQGGYKPTAGASARDQYDPLDASGNVVEPTTWVTLASLTIPAGLYDGINRPRVAFSDSPFKHFRCRAKTDSGVVVQAYLHKAE
ncbi:MAG: hypothetical protein Ta2B_09270 [Termitinemataceae bacterium]|nr:MAG: hypothetical protein Ta2B_09270 [Termitinemataceae bacterium]